MVVREEKEEAPPVGPRVVATQVAKKVAQVGSRVVATQVAKKVAQVGPRVVVLQVVKWAAQTARVAPATKTVEARAVQEVGRAAKGVVDSEEQVVVRAKARGAKVVEGRKAESLGSAEIMERVVDCLGVWVAGCLEAEAGTQAASQDSVALTGVERKVLAAVATLGARAAA